MKGMEEKMLKKKNEFFVIFGMLALCAMLVSACEDKGGGEEDKQPDPPTPQEQLNDVASSLSAAKVGKATASAGALSITLTGGTTTTGASFAISELDIGGTKIKEEDLLKTIKVTKDAITIPAKIFVEAEDLDEISPDDGVDVTAEIKVTGSDKLTAVGSVAIPAASIASLTPAILALRQVKADLAKTGGSATITEAGTAAILLSTGTVNTVVGTVPVLLSGSTTVSGSNDSFDDEDIASTFSNAFVIGTVASFSGVNGVLGIKDEGYAILPGVTTIDDIDGESTPSGTITAVGTNSAGSDTVTFKPVLSGSVSAAFDGIILTAEKLTYTAPLFTITVHTDRYGEEYEVVVGTGSVDP
jgi:hypothetical protein